MRVICFIMVFLWTRTKSAACIQSAGHQNISIAPEAPFCQKKGVPQTKMHMSKPAKSTIAPGVPVFEKASAEGCAEDKIGTQRRCCGFCGKKKRRYGSLFWKLQHRGCKERRTRWGLRGLAHGAGFSKGRVLPCCVLQHRSIGRRYWNTPAAGTGRWSHPIFCSCCIFWERGCYRENRKGTHCKIL